ncbi:MAG TPA: hypothetical protein VK906_11420 [Egicoccus sp.]|nr:hypothetical protein [Egicoccus sp.]HSK23781.1 hypothetical protein [Egicoccus sp.]
MTAAPTTAEPTLDEALLTDAIRRLRDAEQAAAAARSRAAVAKEEVALTLFATTEPYRDGAAPPPLDIIDHLYWDVRDLRITDIARAFGLTNAQLTKLVQPHLEPAHCTDCGRDLEVLRRNRGDKRAARCEPCERAERDRLEAEALRQRRELERARVGGYDDLDGPPPGAFDDEPSPPVGYVGAYPAWDVPPPQHPDTICDVCNAPPGVRGW